MTTPITTAPPSADSSHNDKCKHGIDCVTTGPHTTIDHESQNLLELREAFTSGGIAQIIEAASRLVGRDAVVAMPAHELLSVKQVAMRLNVSTRSVWRLAGGELPQPILIGHARRWHASDVDGYLKKLTEKRDGMKRRLRG